MANNPITDAALAYLDRLAVSASRGGLTSLVDQETYRSELARAYPALRQRLLDAESRLAEAEREIEFLRSAGEAEVNFWVNVIRSLDTENLCDFFDGEGAKEELQRWLAARDAKQRREGAAEWLEKFVAIAAGLSTPVTLRILQAEANRLREGKDV